VETENTPGLAGGAKNGATSVAFPVVADGAGDCRIGGRRWHGFPLQINTQVELWRHAADVLSFMTTGTRIFGWCFTCFLSMAGLSAVLNHRLVGRHGVSMATGHTADILGAIMLLLAAYFSYLLRTSKAEPADPAVNRKNKE
jgi:hypothetical protein